MPISQTDPSSVSGARSSALIKAAEQATSISGLFKTFLIHLTSDEAAETEFQRLASDEQELRDERRLGLSFNPTLTPPCRRATIDEATQDRRQIGDQVDLIEDHQLIRVFRGGLSGIACGRREPQHHILTRFTGGFRLCHGASNLHNLPGFTQVARQVVDS
ncbi:MAG: hypothetical protein O3C21_19940 [Verrucomicrobia bacterium]|nr:hypothetical protein [Verrucomicrobiota bacterium]